MMILSFVLSLVHTQIIMLNATPLILMGASGTSTSRFNTDPPW